VIRGEEKAAIAVASSAIASRLLIGEELLTEVSEFH